MVLDIFNIFVLVESIWLILPAYAGNGLVPIFRKYCRHPIDGGRHLGKNRLFGDGKTWEGFFIGIIIVIFIALVEQLAFPFLPWDMSPVALVIFPMNMVTGILLGFGAMLGDLFGSFIKRRLGIDRGRPTFFIDQEFFVIFALLFAGTASFIKYQWIIFLLIITPIIHWIANLIGYFLGVTRRPW